MQLKLAQIRSFNSRARVGRDQLLLGLHNFALVSTHAPAWGATQLLFHCRQGLEFQLTRPRGARPPIASCRSAAILFQLTRPRGARRGKARKLEKNYEVSTHAPAWGATMMQRR